jgi:hypothetical protein
LQAAQQLTLEDYLHEVEHAAERSALDALCAGRIV